MNLPEQGLEICPHDYYPLICIGIAFPDGAQAVFMLCPVIYDRSMHLIAQILNITTSLTGGDFKPFCNLFERHTAGMTKLSDNEL